MRDRLRLTGVLCLAALLVVGCSQGGGETATPTQAAATASAPEPSPVATTPEPVLAPREQAEAKFIATLRGVIAEKGYDVSDLSDAQAIAEGDRLCAELDAMVEGGVEPSYRELTLKEMLANMASSDPLDGGEVEKRTAALAVAAVGSLCPEYQGIK